MFSILVLFILLFFIIHKKNTMKETFDVKQEEIIDETQPFKTLFQEHFNSFLISSKQKKKLLFNMDSYLNKHNNSIYSFFKQKKFSFDILNHTIVPQKKYNVFKHIIWLYLFINQDHITKEDLYKQYVFHFGVNLYFYNKDEFITIDKTIYQKVPIDYHKILDIKDIQYFFESNRKNNIVPFYIILYLKEYMHIYLEKKNKKIRKRGLPLKQEKKQKKFIFDGIDLDNNEYEPIKEKKKYIYYEDRMKRPLHYGQQRAWQNTYTL